MSFRNLDDFLDKMGATLPEMRRLASTSDDSDDFVNSLPYPISDEDIGDVVRFYNQLLVSEQS